MDKKDLKLIIELDKNLRESYSKIGKVVGLSKQAVKARIDSLLKSNVITTYIAFINMNALGIIPTKIFLSLQNITPAKKQEIIKFLKNDPRSGALMQFEGQYDLFAGVMVHDQLELDEFISEIYNLFSGNIREKKLVTLADSYVFPRGYLYEDRVKPLLKIKHFFVHPTERVELKQLDYQIIGELTRSPVVSWTELSGKLNTSVQNISNRIKYLEKNGVVDGYGILLNESTFVSYILLVELNTLTKDVRKRIFHFAQMHPNFILMVRTVGEWNYEFGIEGLNLNECLSAMNDFKSTFAAEIRSVTPLLIKKVEKMHNYKA